MYEDSELGYFKTHYYGGIKKYQWTTTPLALHGVICRRDGIKIDVSIGEDPADPVLYIPDLLIHLAGDQMKKPLATGVTAEQLNVLLGSEPLAGDDGADRVKLALLNLLFQRYGITEADFLTAELTMVPAAKACEVGLDRSMIGAYGHDDRVCAYAAFAPLLDLDVPSYTAVCVLADKEEIGSVGVSGMQSRCFETFLGDLCQSQGVPLRRCLEHAFCLSADVTNAFDPTFADTCDRRNNAKLNYGIGVCKYTGARGKSGASTTRRQRSSAISPICLTGERRHLANGDPRQGRPGRRRHRRSLYGKPQHRYAGRRRPRALHARPDGGRLQARRLYDRQRHARLLRSAVTEKSPRHRPHICAKGPKTRRCALRGGFFVSVVRCGLQLPRFFDKIDIKL